MTRPLLAATLLCVGLVPCGRAATAPRDMDGYCRIIEADVLSLANSVHQAHDEWTRASADRKNTDPVRLAPLSERLADQRAALEQRESEWNRLGCAQILYGRAPRP